MEKEDIDAFEIKNLKLFRLRFWLILIAVIVLGSILNNVLMKSRHKGRKRRANKLIGENKEDEENEGVET